MNINTPLPEASDQTEPPVQPGQPAIAHQQTPGQPQTKPEPRKGMNDARSAGLLYIEQLLAEHPNVKGVVDIISSTLDFFLGGHVFVWLVNKLIMTAGRIAESVLMLGTLWITSELVAGKELNGWIATFSFLPNASGLPAQITTLCVMAFSLIPEIILLSSIVTTFKRWWITFHQQSWLRRLGWGVWAVLYTLPTVAFVVLVYITFEKLTSVKNMTDIVQAGTDTIQARVLAGWFYSIVEMLYPLIMKTVQELNATLGMSATTPDTTTVVPVVQTVVQPQVKPVDIDALRLQIVDELKPLLQVVQPQFEPVNVEELRASIVEDLKPLVQTSLVQTHVEPAVNVEELVQKLTPLVVQRVSPEPLDYDRLAKSIAPHFAGQIKTMRATIIEEVMSVVPQIAAGPVVEAKKKPAKRTVSEEPEKPEHERLESALQTLLDEGKKPSCRNLSEATGIYRKKVTEWLKVNHFEYVDPKNGGSNSGSNSGSLNQLSQDDEDIIDDLGGSNSGSLNHSQNDEEDLLDGSNSGSFSEEEVVQTTENLEPISEELPAVSVDAEPVLVD